MKKILMTILCAMFFTFGIVFSANALTIDARNYPAFGDQPGTGTENFPSSPGNTLNYYWGNEVSQPAIDSIISAYLDDYDSKELYKSDYIGPEKENGVIVTPGLELGSDSGEYADQYDTTFNPFAEGDPTNAYITFTGGDAIVGATHLLVKDGAATPAWYLFDITGLWHGEATISLLNFWADTQGAISHVTLYGPNGTKVPEPGMVILLGIGLIGLALFSRKRLLN